VVNDAVATADGVVMTDQQDDVNNSNGSADDVLNGDDVNNLMNDDSDVARQSTRTANTQQLIKQQHEDKSLANCWLLAKRDKAGYFVRDVILYRKEKILGHDLNSFVCRNLGGTSSGWRTPSGQENKKTFKTFFHVADYCRRCDACLSGVRRVSKRRRVTV